MNANPKKFAVIIGAGPAGLTAAYELLEKTDVIPLIYEISDQVGGLSKTINYKGNRIDIGGHRFFSKFDKVNYWWQKFLPIQSAPAKDDLLLNKQHDFDDISKIYSEKSDPEKADDVMLVRNRLSRIFFLRKFFSYPVSLSYSTLSNLGMSRVTRIGISYLTIRMFPIRKEVSLQDFFINRFGKELYKTFFKDYTEKVWGVPCDKISSAWGAQRVKGLSISRAILHAFRSTFFKNKSISQKKVETSLIERFKYPKFGPGHLWERVANEIEKMGGKIFLQHQIIGLSPSEHKIGKVTVKNLNENKTEQISCDYVFSSMPVKDLIAGFNQDIPKNVKKVSQDLCYRDFMTVGLLLNKLKIKNETNIETVNNIVPDNWIYIQERDVKIGRLQIFNNWSPYMVSDLKNVWIGLEYFCQECDQLWNMPDKEFLDFAIDELCKIGIIEKKDVLDGVVIRMPKTYPAYFGSYDRFEVVKSFVNKYKNLFLIGRNGMHRYNNMDHSMLTAMQAVENIIKNIESKENIWAINAEQEYHEEKASK